VQAIQEQQMVVSEKLENLETDNKILWGEMTRLRDRHQLQQQTINRILYFLTSIYAPDRLAVGEQKRGMLTV
jgi:heat shock transcription factor